MEEELKYAGTTMNERLWESGRSEEFYAALKQKDADKIAQIYIELGAAGDYTEALKKAKSCIQMQRWRFAIVPLTVTALLFVTPSLALVSYFKDKVKDLRRRAE